MENEVVGQDRWACFWKTLWHGFKAQSRGSKATLGEGVPGPKARLPHPTPQGSLLPAFPVLPIPEALSLYFVSRIKWNPTTGGEAPRLSSLRCERSGLKKAGDGDGPGAGPQRPAAAVMAATVASLALLAAQPSAILNIFPASCSPRRWPR